LRTIEEILAELHNVQGRIAPLEQQIAADEKESRTAEFKALPEAERLARLQGLNNKQPTLTRRIWKKSVCSPRFAARSFSRRSLLSFALFLFCASVRILRSDSVEHARTDGMDVDAALDSPVKAHGLNWLDAR